VDGRRFLFLRAVFFVSAFFWGGGRAVCLGVPGVFCAWLRCRLLWCLPLVWASEALLSILGRASSLFEILFATLFNLAPAAFLFGCGCFGGRGWASGMHSFSAETTTVSRETAGVCLCRRGSSLLNACKSVVDSSLTTRGVYPQEVNQGSRLIALKNFR